MRLPRFEREVFLLLVDEGLKRVLQVLLSRFKAINLRDKATDLYARLGSRAVALDLSDQQAVFGVFGKESEVWATALVAEDNDDRDVFGFAPLPEDAPGLLWSGPQVFPAAVGVMIEDVLELEFVFVGLKADDSIADRSFSVSFFFFALQAPK